VTVVIIIPVIIIIIIIIITNLYSAFRSEDRGAEFLTSCCMPKFNKIDSRVRPPDAHNC